MVATGVRDQRVPWVPRVLVMVPRLTRGYPCTRVTRGITREWRVPMPEYPLGTGDGLRKNDGYPYPWVFTRVAPYAKINKPDSSKLNRSFLSYGAKMPCILSHSAPTAARSAEAASPWRQTSLILYLID